MAEVVEVADRAALVAHLAKDLARCGYALTDDDLRIRPYGYDGRIGWDTHIVTLREKEVSPGVWYFGGMGRDYFGAIGFTDGPDSASPSL